MKIYKYKGSNDFYYYDSLIAMPEDTIQIDSEGNVTNKENGCKVISLPEEIMNNLLADCKFVEEAEEPKEILNDDDRFKLIIQHMYDTFKRKNHDYGNSFEQSLNEEGLAASRIRVGDKWNRFKTLSKCINCIEVKDESITDTLMDMANYCIMTIMWLQKNRK